jgi:hypothetical protein
LFEHESHVAKLAGTDVNLAVALRIRRWFLREGRMEFSARDAFTNSRGVHVRKATDVESALVVLEDFGHIRRRPDPDPRPKGRPPSPHFDVNPRLAECAEHAKTPAAEPQVETCAHSAHSAQQFPPEKSDAQTETALPEGRDGE